jgi:RHS repeat-associated protein
VCRLRQRRYDVLGRRTSVGASQTGAPQVTYTYDAAGRPYQVLQGGVVQATAGYDTAGRLQQLSLANSITAAYTYNGVDRLIRLQTTSSITNTTLTDFQYTLNRGGQVSSASEAVGQSSRALTYTYDGLNRLTQAQEQPTGGTAVTYGYSYDLVGNRTQATKDGTTLESHTYDASDQISDTGWQYDAAGNLTADGTNTYTYDPLNRLTSVAPTAQGSTTTQYNYNGDGVLAAKQRGTYNTHYVLDSITGLPERLGSISLDSGQSTWFVRGWGQELSRTASSGTGTEWYLSDRLGSIRGLTDSAGQVTAGYDYDPYGTPEGTSLPQDYGFTGEPQDQSTALVQLRARWYSPGAGRFLTQDSYSGSPYEPRTLPRYPYVGDDPTNLLDHSGMYWETPGDYQKANNEAFDAFSAKVTALSSMPVRIAPSGVYYQEVALGGDPGFLALRDGLNNVRVGVQWWSHADRSDLVVETLSDRGYCNSIDAVQKLQGTGWCLKGVPAPFVTDTMQSPNIFGPQRANRIGADPVEPIHPESTEEGAPTHIDSTCPLGEIPGDKVSNYIPEQYRGDVLSSFEGEIRYNPNPNGTIVYQHVTGEMTQATSPYFTDKVYSPEEAQSALALPTTNTATHVYMYEIPPGQPYIEGGVKQQTGKRFWPHATGGGRQIYLADPSVARQIGQIR